MIRIEVGIGGTGILIRRNQDRTIDLGLDKFLHARGFGLSLPKGLSNAPGTAERARREGELCLPEAATVRVTFLGRTHRDRHVGRRSPSRVVTRRSLRIVALHHRQGGSAIERTGPVGAAEPLQGTGLPAEA